MVSWQPTHVTRLAALAALAASAALLMHYLHPNPQFCGFHADCDKVILSRFGRILGMPLPVLGVVTFGVLFVLSLSPAQRVGRLFQILALGAAGIGLVLILIQVLIIGYLCPYCLIVDLSALVIAAVELGVRRGRPLPVVSRRGSCVWLGAAAGCLSLVVVLGSQGSWRSASDPTPAPPEITALWVPDKVNVVEIADFQCAHCRRMNAVLMQFLHVEGNRIHFVRLTAPMPDYPQARYASRAFLCAERQGKGNEVAEALFATPDLTPEACEQLAVSSGVSLVEFRACVRDPRTDQSLDATVAWAMAASPKGLPIVWVQDRMLLGEHSYGALRDAVNEAEERLQRPAP
jgi:uncharacterized membrane protein